MTQQEPVLCSLSQTIFFNRMRFFWLTLALAILATGCARHRAEPVAEEPAPLPVLGTITLVPVEPPANLFTNNRSAPVIGWLWVGLANSVLDKSKSADFDALHADYRRQLGEKLTQTVRRELETRGFPVRLAMREEVKRNKDNMVKFRKFVGHEVVLDIQYDEVGMYSSRLDVNYLPLMSTSVFMARPDEGGELLFDYSYVYGAYATKTQDGYIVSDQRFAFDSFESLMNKPELVRNSLDEGIEKIARNLGDDIAAQFRPPPRPERQARPAPPAPTPAAVIETAPQPAKPPVGAKTKKRGAAKTVAAR